MTKVKMVGCCGFWSMGIGEEEWVTETQALLKESEHALWVHHQDLMDLCYSYAENPGTQLQKVHQTFYLLESI